MVCESALVVGGAEKVAIQEAKELAKRGFRVGYIAANDSADQELTDAGVEVLLLNTKSFFEEDNRRQKFQKLIANREIESDVETLLRSFDPSQTVVHLHTFRLRLSGNVAHIAQKMGFTTVIHFHDYSPICPTSLLFDHRSGANCNRKPMSLSCITCECQNQPWKYKLPKLTSHFWNQSVWNLNDRSQGHIHISELERSTAEQANGLSKNSFYAPPISNFSVSTRVKAEENQSYVFIGRLTPEKGIESFLEAVTVASVSAVVIGDGPLKELLIGKYQNVRFTGWINESDILCELKSARAVVVPSLWRETLCLSVIDAMTLGVPCIVSENVGAKEFIVDGESGMVFDEGKLQESLHQFSNNETVQAMSQKAFEVFIISPPTIEKHVDALLKIYEKCLAGEPQ